MMKKILKSKKGFTLVEALTSMVLLCVLIGLVSGIVLFSMNDFSRTSASSSAQMLANSAYNFISNRLTYATNIEIGSNNGGYAQAMKIADGKLYYKNETGDYALMLGDSAYNGMTIETTTKATDAIMTLTIKVNYGDGKAYERTSSFKMINIERSPDAVLGGTTGTADNQTIYFS